MCDRAGQRGRPGGDNDDQTHVERLHSDGDGCRSAEVSGIRLLAKTTEREPCK